MPVTREMANGRLLLSKLFPAHHDDWLVKVWFRNRTGADDYLEIHVGKSGEPLSMEQARDAALDSLKKTVISAKTAEWSLPPRIYDIVAEPHHKTKPKHESVATLLDRLKELKPGGKLPCGG